MGLLDTLKKVAIDVINEQPKTMYGTVTKYYDGSVTVETDDGLLENIKCVNVPKIGTACILVPVGEEYTCIPNEMDDSTEIYAKGLGKFTVNDDGDLIYDLSVGISNYFSLSNDGDLIVNLDETTNHKFSIEDGCVIYEE